MLGAVPGCAQACTVVGDDTPEAGHRFLSTICASRLRSQHGYTLLEVLLVVAISGLILGPLFAWTLLTMRQQPVQRDGMVISAQAGLLRGSFPRDVTVAGAARAFDPAGALADEPGTEWSTWREPCVGGAASGGAGVRHLAVLISQGESRLKTIYSVAPMRAGNSVVANRYSVWRTQCGANTGALRSQSQLVEDVDRSAAATSASCAVTPSAPPTTVADPADACRQVTIRVTQRANDGDLQPPIVLSATRRTDLASLAADPGGNFLPIARITVVNQTWNGAGSPATTVRLSAADSSDPDGSSLAYRWELPNGPEGTNPTFDTGRTDQVVDLVLRDVGVYWVRLTVTDDDGAQNFAYRRLEVTNRAPIAAASVSPLTAIAGVTTIQMDGTGSNDPDDAIVSHRWRISSALPDDLGAGFEWTSDQPTATFAVPAWAIGDLNVELTVTDRHGTSSVEVQPVAVVDPNQPPETTTTLPGEEPEPEPGAPVARFVATRVSGTTYSFDAGGSEGDGLTYAWQFGLLAGNGSGSPLQYTYPGPGTYIATLTVTDSQGRTARRTLEVVVPGTPAAPANVRVTNNVLMWDPRPGARRYLVDLEASNNGCARSILNQPVAASASPQRALPPNPCTGAGTTARARVGVEGSAGGAVAWSGWIDVPVVVK